jgi:hypothetical protein
MRSIQNNEFGNHSMHVPPTPTGRKKRKADAVSTDTNQGRPNTQSAENRWKVLTVLQEFLGDQGALINRVADIIQNPKK